MTDGVADAHGTIPRRDAAIFFVAPDISARLEPVVREGEVPHYASTLTHGDFKVSLCDQSEFVDDRLHASLLCCFLAACCASCRAEMTIIPRESIWGDNMSPSLLLCSWNC